MAKVFIGVGHGYNPTTGLGDPGAVANGLKESDVNLVMALAMQKELLRHGVTVGMSRTKEELDPLAEEIAECKAFAPDLAVEVHNNAGGGDGFEVYYQTNTYKAKSLAIAQAIEKQVKAIGQNSRGCKTLLSGTVDYYGWLRQTNGSTILAPFCPAVLCEGAFLDNATDVKIIDTKAEQEAFGVAYAKGVLDYLGIAYIPESNPPTGIPEGYVPKAELEAAITRAVKAEAKADELETSLRALQLKFDTLVASVKVLSESAKALAAKYE